MNIRKWFIAFLTVSILLCLAGCGAESAANSIGSASGEAVPTAQEKAGETTVTTQEKTGEAEMTITVTGNGTTYVTPDRAELMLSIETEGMTPEQSQQDNTTQLDTVLDCLHTLGIEDKSIQTVGYYINQNYDYNTNTIVSYRTQTVLSVKDLLLEEAGHVISEAVHAGVTNVQNISFTASNYDDAYSEALADAISLARTKANALADASGLTIDKVIRIQEGYQNTTARYSRNSVSDMVMEEAEISAKSVSLMAGQIEITAPVTVTFSVRDESL